MAAVVLIVRSQYLHVVPNPLTAEQWEHGVAEAGGDMHPGGGVQPGNFCPALEPPPPINDILTSVQPKLKHSSQLKCGNGFRPRKDLNGGKIGQNKLKIGCQPK